MLTTIKNEFYFMPKSSIKAGTGLTNGNYPFFTSSDVKLLYLNDYLFDDELVIIGTGGKPSCNYYNGKFSCSTDNYTLKTKGRIKAKYLYYLLRKDNLSILQKGFHGAGLQHIGKDYIESISFDLISLNKQDEIIKNIDNISCIIREKIEELSYLDELVKSRFMCQETYL